MRTVLSRLFLICIVTLSQLYCPFASAADTPPNRISFAISGGASKGAYEAGLVWGLIEAIRQLENTKDAAFGGELRPINIASIAGTSAGGINTLLAALAWAVNSEEKGGFTNRIGDNIFRDVWLTPDVNRLLPPGAESPLYLPDDALLSRKDLIAVARDVTKKWRQPGTFRPGIHLPLGVSVTRVRPDTLNISGVEVRNQRFFIPFEMRVQRDGRAEFSFQPDDYPSLIDPAMIIMPWQADRAPYSISDQQIEDTLMMTSAFPGGFGRKRLTYCRRKTTSPEADHTGKPARVPDDAHGKLVCPEGYGLVEAEFADGGLFDNLPIGLTRSLAESNRLDQKSRLAVNYIYVDPDRKRFKKTVPEEQGACAGESPPEACRQMTYDLASELVVLGGAIGTARKYELYRELTGDNWRLNLSQLSNEIATIMDTKTPPMDCAAALPYFDGQPQCSDRLRYTGRLLSLTNGYRIVPIIEPFSTTALKKAGIANTCRSPSKSVVKGIVSECSIDAVKLREKLADVLLDVSAQVAAKDENFRKDIKQSALSVNSDRRIHVTSRGGAITGVLLDDFGAFLDYKFREFDYYIGVYDAIVVLTDNLCTQNFPGKNQTSEINFCRDRLSEQIYHAVGVPGDSKGQYLFALAAQHEFGKQGGLRYAYEPMPPADRDIRIIYQGLNKPAHGSPRGADGTGELVSDEIVFFEHLKRQGFEPTPSTDGGASLLTQIMEEPEYWLHELAKRATDRLMHLEKQAEKVYQAREPDPEKQEKAHTALMGAGSLVLRTATYKYPTFSFSPSTAPDTWILRNIIPYEAAFDFAEGDFLFFWQPTWRLKRLNAGLRFGLGFTGGITNSNADKTRENFGTLGLDLTRNESTAIFSGWGIMPAAYHTWQKPEIVDQTTFGFDIHACLFKNRIRISLGTRDVLSNANDTVFLTLGVADLPGLIYWMSR